MSLRKTVVKKNIDVIVPEMENGEEKRERDKNEVKEGMNTQDAK